MQTTQSIDHLEQRAALSVSEADRRGKAVARAAGVLACLRDECGDRAWAEALCESIRRELRECTSCGDRTQHREGMCLSCGGRN